MMIVALLLSLLLAPPAHPAELRHDGRWLRDREGRVVVLHGVNMVNKLPPYRPDAVGFSRDDARLLRRLGFNTVRLGIVYKGLEPAQGRYDTDYLDSIARTARMLGRYGIHVLVDFHQDMYNERFNGEGWPDWATLDDGLPPEPDNGFPYNYFQMPALWRAYDHFWANDEAAGMPLQDAYAKAWVVAAARLRGEPAVFGYDMLNEPFPGSQWQTCASPAGCAGFEAGPLTEFHRKVAKAIRTVDRRKLIAYEATLFFDFGADTAHGPLGDPGAVFSFHPYCLGALFAAGEPQFQPYAAESCGEEEQITFDNAQDHVEAAGATPLITEFGATDERAAINRVVEEADRRMIGWQYWAWHNEDPCCKRPQEGLFERFPDLRTLKPEKAKLLSRAYPRAIAGEPESWHFDSETGRFALVWKPGRGRTTEVFVPRLHFPRGYRARAVGARVTSRRGRPVLKLVAKPTAKRAKVTVSRR